MAWNSKLCPIWNEAPTMPDGVMVRFTERMHEVLFFICRGSKYVEVRWDGHEEESSLRDRVRRAAEELCAS